MAAVVFALPAEAQRRQSLSDRMAALEARMAQVENATDDEETRRVLADMVATLNELRQDLANLRGLIEDQGFQIDQIRAVQQDQYLDLDRRIAALSEPRPRPGLPPFPADDGGPTQIDPDGVEFGRTPLDADDPVAGQPLGELPEVRPPIDPELETTGLGETPEQAITSLADPEREKADYDTAFAALKDGRYAESARLFSSFVDRYPNGEYADNAQYWLGESYYVTGNYRIALDAFQKLIGRFPASSKVPDAKLKLGFTHYELEQWQAAEQMLNEVIRDYPSTTVSRLAENRLRMMRIEGHVQ